MNHANDNNTGLRFLSVCSGIEAASVAWPDWTPVAFSEIEKFPSAVLAHHYPDVPNLGDFTKIDTTTLGRVDILCGGTPCQAFSVAGLRKGLDDERGNLTLKFVELAHELAGLGKTDGNGLRNVIWENVVGVLSDKGNAFGCFLAGLVGADAPIVPPGKWTNAGMVSGPRGRAAWRVLDAQYFGLAQRRRRVIVVADFGNGADPASVLLIEQGLPRHPPARGEAGKDVAGAVKGGAGSGGECRPTHDVVGTLCAEDSPHGARGLTGLQTMLSGYIQPVHFAPEIARCDATREGSSQDYETTTMVAVGVAPTMRAGGNRTGGDRPYGTDVDTCDSLAICFSAKDYGADASVDIAPTLRAGGHTNSHANAGVMPAIAFNAEAQADQLPTEGRDTSVNDGLTVSQRAAVATTSAVRRLTPRECERLQGFQWLCAPDYPGAWQDEAGRWWSPDYTLIPCGNKLKGEVKEELAAYFEKTGQYMKEVSEGEWAFDREAFEKAWPRISADGPRYKALGNSWAVPKFVWLGKRIAQFMPVTAANDNTTEEATLAAA